MQYFFHTFFSQFHRSIIFSIFFFLFKIFFSRTLFSSHDESKRRLHRRKSRTILKIYILCLYETSRLVALMIFSSLFCSAVTTHKLRLSVQHDRAAAYCCWCMCWGCCRTSAPKPSSKIDMCPDGSCTTIKNYQVENCDFCRSIELVGGGGIDKRDVRWLREKRATTWAWRSTWLDCMYIRVAVSMSNRDQISSQTLFFLNEYAKLPYGVHYHYRAGKKKYLSA